MSLSLWMDSKLWGSYTMTTLTVFFPFRGTLTDGDSLCFHINLGIFFLVLWKMTMHFWWEFCNDILFIHIAWYFSLFPIYLSFSFLIFLSLFLPSLFPSFLVWLPSLFPSLETQFHISQTNLKLTTLERMTTNF